MSKLAFWHRRLFLFLILLLPLQLGKHFWPPWSLVLGLKIDYLSPTIYLTDFLVAMILALWVIDSKIKIPKFKVLLFPISIFCFLFINSLFAQNSGAAFYKFIKIFEFSLLGFYVFRNIVNIVVPLSFAVFYSSLLAVAQFIKQGSLGSVFWWFGERTFNSGTPGIAQAIINGQLVMRPYATFSHPNALAGFLIVGLILTLPSIFKQNKPLGIGYLLLAMSALILTFSRAVWLVGLMILGIYLFKRQKIVLAALPLFVLIIVFLFGQQFSTNEALFQRLQLAQVAGLMIQSSPLMGVGLNNFIPRLPDFWQNLGWTYWLQPVHNIYLLVAAEIGLLGLLIFLWFFVLTYKKLLAINNYLLITTLSSILLLGLFDHYWLTLQQNQLLLAVVLGLSWTKPRGRIKQ